MLETQAVTAPRAVLSTPRRAERSFTVSSAVAPSHLTIDSSPSRPSPSRKSADRLARSEARLMMAAGACTTIFCAILVIYLAAYARVTNLGLAQSHARVHLRNLSQENQILRAQLAQVQSPDRIVAQAAVLGMASGGRQVCYITPRGEAARTNAISDTADQTISESGHETSRVASSGANSDDITSTSLGH